VSINNKKVVVTGIGPITPIGIGKQSIIEGMIHNKTGLMLYESKLEKDTWDVSFVHKVDKFDINSFGIDQNDLEYIRNWKEGEDNRDLLFLLAAVKLAFEDARIDYTKKNHQTAIIVTHENPGLEQCLAKTYQTMYGLYCNRPKLGEKQFYDEVFAKTLKTGYETQSFMTLFHIGRTFNIKNYSLFINNACASGLYAIESASDLIKLGKSKQVIVVAGDCPNVFKTIWLKNIKMYQEDGKIKPFDLNAQGFVLGEGSVALVLEDYDYAKNRDAQIYAEYLGGGFRLEGWGVTTPMIGGQFYQEAMRDALRYSRVSIDDIDLICAHGVGTPSSDYYEAKAITDVFGKSRVPVTALKPYVGHNLGGSTLIELALLLLSLENKTTPRIKNTENPNVDLGLNLITKEEKTNSKIFMKTCCAFAGFNAASIFRRGF
jgi:3-oxoacyl-[acyl-carrier-protein] synthase II